MQLKVTGRHIEVTKSLNSYIRDKITRLKRHFDQVLNVHVILEVQKTTHTAEASIHLSGNHIFADAKAEDMYVAIDALIDKLDRQIVKHKEKLKDHHRQEGSHRKVVEQAELETV